MNAQAVFHTSCQKGGGKHFFLLLFAFVSLLVIIGNSSSPKLQSKVFGIQNACSNNTPPVVLTIVGDLLIGSGKVWQQIVKDDYSPAIMGDYLDVFKKSNSVFANFEGIISERDKPRQKNLPSQFSLKTDPAIVRFLKHFGNNVVLSFANNHSADFGHDAIYDTIDLLEKSDIAYVGIGRNRQEAFAPRIIGMPGTHIAFLAFTDLLPKQYYASDAQAGIAELTSENLQTAIALAKQSSDFVVVSLHTAQDIATPFSFWPDSHQKLFSRLAIDYGADVVVGQHQHGLQLVEKYRGKLIFYSLGLFLYDPSVSQRYPPTHPLSQAAQFNGGGVLTLEICRDGMYSFDLAPTKVIDHEQKLAVVPASFPTQLLTKFITSRLFDF